MHPLVLAYNCAKRLNAYGNGKDIKGEWNALEIEYHQQHQHPLQSSSRNKTKQSLAQVQLQQHHYSK